MARQSSRRNRHRRASAQQEVAAIGLPQLERKKLRNRFAPVEPLDQEQVELIHDASLRLLEQQGIEVLGDQALARFRQAGAVVDADGIVKMERGLVLETIAKAPAEFTLMPRNSENAVRVGGDAINFGLVSGPPNVHDNIHGRRAGNIDDYRKVISFGQYFNVLTFFGNQALAPIDLPANNRHLDTTLLNLTLSDKVFFATGIGGGRARDAVELCAIARGLSLDEMLDSPAVLTNININSPRKLDDSMAYGAMQMAMLGQAVAVTPFTLMGAMTPATMAGALVQQNAEALLGISLVQLTRPGAPVVYGGFTSNVDMRSGAPAFGTPENALANMAGGQFARKYNLPYRTSACNASNTVDGQATWETQMALWGAVMGHGNLIYHSAGWLEGGLVASFEKIVMDCEMLQHMSSMLEPIKIDLAEMGLEAIEEVGPGGHFFGCAHTLERYKTAFYQPFLSDWQNHENWVLAGAKDATMRATETWQRVLNEFEQPPTDPAIREALQAYVAKRKEKLKTNEPELEPTPL
ncbi:trimethylamine methyltransferase family protein [Candidatus Spongiihabitans sp.]|uniref:trimethylamine methyltransferase family protein n=1 Tax=Candidatus Spongiihabitans sp. TaxID=3101308 RepID=UPI003C7A2589